MAESAYDIQKRILRSYGLPDSSDVMTVINEGALAGDSDDIIALRLQETQTWKTRFAGNEKLRAAGLPVLSIPEYLAQERQYANVLHNAALPTGFYDDPADFADFIGKSVSVAELQDRVNLAADIVSREDPAILDQLAARGISAGSLLAHALDPDRAAPLIKREQSSILIGAAAQRSRFGISVAQADRLAGQGIGESQATQGFGQINDFYGTTQKLGEVYGENYGAEDALSEVFQGDAGDKRKRLAGQERSNFSGSTGYGVEKRSVAGRY